MEDSRTEERKNFMKPTFADPLKKREQFAVSLRKQKTSEIINAKRRKIMGAQSGKDDFGSSGSYKGNPEFEAHPDELARQVQLICPEIYNEAKNQPIATKIQILFNKLITDNLDNKQQLVVMTQVRRMISGTDEPPIAEILGQTSILNVISTVFRFQDTSEDIKYMKMESLWALTNLVFGSNEVIAPIFDPQHFFLQSINTFMKSDSQAMVDQCLWFIGNAIADSLQIRDMVLQNTDLILLMKEMIKAHRISRVCLKNMVWVCSNIFRLKNIDDSYILDCLPIANAGLFCDDADINSDALWTLSYMADTKTDALINDIASDEVVGRVCQFMGEKDLSIFVPALRCMGNILTTDNHAIIDKCLWHQVLDRLSHMLFSSNSNVIKECCWALSNIAAGTQLHIQRMVESEAFARILNLAHSKNIDNKKEALWVICNSITGADPYLRTEIVTKGANEMISGMVKGCYCTDPRLLSNILEAIEEILNLDEFNSWKATEKSVAFMFEKNSGLDALEELQKNPNKDVYDKSMQILTKYFELEESMDSQQVNNGMENRGMFNI
eukprot:403350389